jgi:hypothetical protein
MLQEGGRAPADVFCSWNIVSAKHHQAPRQEAGVSETEVVISHWTSAHETLVAQEFGNHRS